MPDPNKTGVFITFEGGEGAGKSTQVARLSARLTSAGTPNHVTREPGGSAFAETVRNLILDPATPPHPPLSEALLFSAARYDHLESIIRPALATGTWVLCDRFMDSTRAYQGAAGGLDTATLGVLEQLVIGPTLPDLTIILDLPVDKAFERVKSRTSSPGTNADSSNNDPYESRNRDFHERLRQGFLAIAQDQPERCFVVDAGQDANDVSEAIWQIVRRATKPE